MFNTEAFLACRRAGLRLLVCLAVVTGFSLPAQAADPAREDKIILMLSNADGLISDLEFMVKTLAKQQKQWTTNIEPNIELFLDGVHRGKPVRVDVFFDAEKAEFYRPHFPINNLAMFRNNLDALGITSKPLGKNLFLLESAFEGQMRILPDYAVFAPTDWVKVIPENLADPQVAIKHLVAPKYDAAVLIDHQPEGIEDRRDSLKAVIKNALNEVKKKSTESVEQYNLRRLLAENQLVNLQQIYAEVDYLEAGWVTDPKEQRGLGTLILAPLPGTTMAKKLEQLNQLKSRFATLPETAGFVATGRLQVPVDAGDQQQLTATYKAILPVAQQKIDDRKNLNATQKQAAKQAVQKTLAALEKGLQLGMVDAFMEVRNAAKAGQQEAIFGVQIVSGQDVEEILNLLPQIHAEFVLKNNVATEQDFRFHEISLNDHVPPMMESLFGKPCKVVVGVSDNTLLLGFGESVLPWLQQTAQHLNSQPEPTALPEFLRFKGHVGPLVKALNAREPNKERPQLRKMLVDAFTQGDDYIELFDKYEDGKIQGTMTVEPGLLRFLGLAVAKFAEENL